MARTSSLWTWLLSAHGGKLPLSAYGGFRMFAGTGSLGDTFPCFRGGRLWLQRGSAAIVRSHVGNGSGRVAGLGGRTGMLLPEWQVTHWQWLQWHRTTHGIHVFCTTWYQGRHICRLEWATFFLGRLRPLR